MIYELSPAEILLYLKTVYKLVGFLPVITVRDLVGGIIPKQVRRLSIAVYVTYQGLPKHKA